ncbi:hypothetical protein H4Q26_000820 [Puccinia striiformis f. sp. tritici PST-130]|nr:hypothetical protein H4Q26_000820 [Puccinia striiformis f. sp. tritici PST-130]
MMETTLLINRRQFGLKYLHTVTLGLHRSIELIKATPHPHPSLPTTSLPVYLPLNQPAYLTSLSKFNGRSYLSWWWFTSWCSSTNSWSWSWSWSVQLDFLGTHSAVANGHEHKINGHSSHHNRSSTHLFAGHQDEPEELKLIRKKHGHNLATIRELFPDWTDEDLLMALNEAAGDLELAAARISEGLAEKWGSVKTKKEKKISSPVLTSSQHIRGHGPSITNALDGRGGRGRSGGRSSRLIAWWRTGAAPRGVGRGQSTSNLARGTHPAVDDPSIAVTTPSSWSLAVTAPNNESANPSGPSTSLATIGNDLGQSLELGQASQAVGTTSTEEAKCETSQPTHDGTQNGVVEPPKLISDTAKKVMSRVITPGTKMSWAQIARPVDPPKPPPVAPAISAPPPPIANLPDTDADSDATKKPSTTETLTTPSVADPQLHDGQVTISIPRLHSGCVAH